MKKLFLFMALVVLLLSLAALGLAAEAKPGEEVEVTLNLSNTNAALVKVKADYDTSVFDLVGYSSSIGTASNSSIIVYDTKTLPSGAIGTVTLKVKESAVPGIYAVPAVLVECFDINEDYGLASVSGGSVTVVSKATPEPTTAPTTEPTEKPTVEPTTEPTTEPTAKPTIEPTVEPTVEPTTEPTAKPTVKPTEKPPVNPTKEPEMTDKRYNQTVCSLGIRFRDIKPELTRKWYMFTPIDLSHNGTQSFDLIVGNAAYIGSVTVDVQGDKFTVNYKLNRSVQERDIALTFLSDLVSVTDVEIKNLNIFAFGEEISIVDDLGGDTNVLLYILGHVDYDHNDERNEKFYDTSKQYKAMVNQWKNLMD